MFAGKEMIERLRLVRVVFAQSVKACQLGGLQERARDGGVRAISFTRSTYLSTHGGGWATRSLRLTRPLSCREAPAAT